MISQRIKILTRFGSGTQNRFQIGIISTITENLYFGSPPLICSVWTIAGFEGYKLVHFRNSFSTGTVYNFSIPALLPYIRPETGRQ